MFGVVHPAEPPPPAGASLPLPANSSAPGESTMIAGSVLPIQRAEELLATLPGVISARIVAGVNGAVEEIHILTTTDVTPKQTVRNVESALIAHLGMRVSHKKISVATSDDATRPGRPQPALQPPVGNAAAPAGTAGAKSAAAPSPVKLEAPSKGGPAQATDVPSLMPTTYRRRIYFEDV